MPANIGWNAMTAPVLALVLLLAPRSQPRRFDPIGTWYSHMSILESRIPSGTPESIRDQLRSNIKAQNDPGWRLIFRKDHTYLLPGPSGSPSASEIGTWSIHGPRLLI